MRKSVEDLVRFPEIAEMMKVKESSARQYPLRNPDFPEPVVPGYYVRSEIENFIKLRAVRRMGSRGRPPRVQVELRDDQQGQ